MLPVELGGGLLNGVGGRRAADRPLDGAGTAAIVIVVGLDGALLVLLLGRVDLVVVGGGRRAGSSLLIQSGNNA